jgi:WD40 repeat protein
MVEPIASWQVGVAVRALHFFRHPESGVALAVVDTNGAVRLYHPEERPGGSDAQSRLVTREDGSVVTFDVPRAPPVKDLSHLPRPTGWPDLVTVGGDGTTRTYDLLTGQMRNSRELPAADELSVVDTMPAADGSAVIAVAGNGNVVHLWRGNPAEPEQLNGHTGPIRNLNALRVERMLAVVDERGIVVWDLSGAGGEMRAACPGRSRSVAVLREQGRVRLVSGADDGIHLWDPYTGRHLAHFARSLSVASVVAFDAEPGEQMLAIASDRTVTLWSPATEARSRAQLDGVPGGTLKLLTRILTGNGTLLAAGDEEGNVTVWRLLPQRRMANLVGSHKDWVNDLAVVAPANHRPLLASASDDRTARLWGIEDIGPYGDPISFQPETQVQALAAVDGDLAIGDQLGYIRRWLVGGDHPCWRKRAHHLPVRAMTSFHSPDGWRIVSAGGSGHCIIWDSESGEVVHELRPPSTGDPAGPPAAPVRAVAAAELAGRWVVAAGDLDGRIEVWDAGTGELYWTLPHAHGHSQVRSLAVVWAGGRVLLASGSSAGSIRLWDLASRQQAGETVGHGGPVSALCAVWDGRLWRLASGGADRDIRLWDPGGLEHPLSEVVNAHERWVRALVQLPSTGAEAGPLDAAAQLASAGEEGSIRLWQIRNGQLLVSTHRPSIRGFQDRLAIDDLLDRDTVATELFELLRPDPPDPPDGPALGSRSAEASSGPQVVLLHGAWGTGKSSLMRDLRRRLTDASARVPTAPAPETFGLVGVVRRWGGWIRRWRGRELSPHQVSRIVTAGAEPEEDPKQPRPPARQTVTAWFNPWAHQSSEQVWSGLAWSIIEGTRDQLGASKAERQRYWLARNVHRLDRGALRRSIRHRIWRPFLTVFAALVVPLALLLARIGVQADAVSQDPTTLGDWLRLLLRTQEPGAGGLLELSLADWLTVGLMLALVVVIAGMGSYAVWQYLFGKASAHLPAEIFDGPIDPAAAASGAGATGERLFRDLPYVSTAGRPYSINRDIDRLVDDLEARGYQLIVFIDDLDRCPASSTVEVFEAVNAFLSDQIYPDTAPRFVIGLDPTVVAGRLAAAQPGPPEALPASDPDDPNLGWSILRKLSQLTVVLPVISPTHTARLLRHHADAAPPAADPPLPLPGSPAGGGAEPASPGRDSGDQAGGGRSRGRRRSGPDTTATATPAAVTSQTSQSEVVALEGEPIVQAHLRDLVELRPRQTMRETKRLLTMWGFYVRLLERLQPLGTANVQDACDAMTLAEIIRRWPALIPALGRVNDQPSGLALLIEAARGEPAGADRQWWAALRRVGLAESRLASATANLRQLLQRHGTDRVARFADLLL